MLPSKPDRRSKWLCDFGQWQNLTGFRRWFQWVMKFGQIFTSKFGRKGGQFMLSFHRPNFHVDLWSKLMLFWEWRNFVLKSTPKFCYDHFIYFFFGLDSTRFRRQIMVEIIAVLLATKFRLKIDVKICRTISYFFQPKFHEISTGFRHRNVIEKGSIYVASSST